MQRASHAKNKEKRNGLSRAYYWANRERLLSRQSERDAARHNEKLAYNRDYGNEHRAELRPYMRDYRYRRKYRISTAEYEALVAEQGGVCALCGGPQVWKSREGLKRLCVDHDHETGKVRGLLCGPCNTALGIVERAAWLERAIAYLAAAKEPGLPTAS